MKNNYNPVLYPLNRDLSKQWFIKFFNPATDKYEKKYGKLNKLATVNERLTEAERIITQELEAVAHASELIKNAEVNQLCTLVEQFYAYKRVGKRAKSVLTYDTHIQVFIKWYRTVWRGGDYMVMGHEFLNYISPGKSNTTINAYKTTIKSVFAAIAKAKKLDIISLYIGYASLTQYYKI